MYGRVNFTIDCATGLGWDVVNPNVWPGESWIVDLFGGDDDGHPVRVRVVYAQSRKTRVYLFREAVVTWAKDDVSRTVTTQKEFWRLLSAYAPKKDD